MKALAIFFTAAALPSVLSAPKKGRTKKSKPKNKPRELTAVEQWNALDVNPGIYNPYASQGADDCRMLTHKELKDLCGSSAVHGGAEYLMADYIKEGQHGFERNKKHAFQWLQKAVKRKHPPALLEMGMYYYNGDHFKVKQDLDKAIDLFTEAANQDHGLANWNLASIYRDESSKRFNRDKALFHMEKAAKLRTSHAYFELVKVYQQGKMGTPVDLDKASFWLKKCYQDTKYVECTALLADRYLRGAKPFPKRWEPGLKMMQEAKQQGHEVAEAFFERLNQGTINELNYDDTINPHHRSEL